MVIKFFDFVEIYLFILNKYFTDCCEFLVKFWSFDKVDFDNIC